MTSLTVLLSKWPLIRQIREISGNYAGALHVIAGVMASSVLLPIIVRPPRREKAT